MTPRPLARMRSAAALLVAALGLTPLAGCNPMQALYFLQPFEPQIPPPCPSLKGKKIVVVTHAVPGTQNDFVTLDRELTRELSTILREKVKKVEVVDPEKVFAWCQGNPSWTDPADLARAFEADIVIDLEVREFAIDSPSSPDLFEGRSNIHVRATEWAHPKDAKGREITDRPKEARELYVGDRDTAFPVTGAIPVSPEFSRSTFKNKFLKVVAAEVSWHFVEHAHGDNIQDTRFNGQ